MEILLSQLAVSLVTLSTLLSPTTAEASIMPYSMPTDAVYSALEGSRLNENIKDVVLRKCVNYKVNCETAVKIVKAESQFKNVPNHLYTGENGKYTAYGPFQITRTTYKAFCGEPSERKDVEKNIDCGLHIMEVSGLQHWDESKLEWSKPNYGS